MPGPALMRALSPVPPPARTGITHGFWQGEKKKISGLLSLFGAEGPSVLNQASGSVDPDQWIRPVETIMVKFIGMQHLSVVGSLMFGNPPVQDIRHKLSQAFSQVSPEQDIG